MRTQEKKEHTENSWINSSVSGSSIIPTWSSCIHVVKGHVSIYCRPAQWPPGWPFQGGHKPPGSDRSSGICSRPRRTSESSVNSWTLIRQEEQRGTKESRSWWSWRSPSAVPPEHSSSFNTPEPRANTHRLVDSGALIQAYRYEGTRGGAAPVFKVARQLDSSACVTTLRSRSG